MRARKVARNKKRKKSNERNKKKGKHPDRETQGEQEIGAPVLLHCFQDLCVQRPFLFQTSHTSPWACPRHRSSWGRTMKHSSEKGTGSAAPWTLQRQIQSGILVTSQIIPWNLVSSIKMELTPMLTTELSEVHLRTVSSRWQVFLKCCLFTFLSVVRATHYYAQLRVTSCQFHSVVA